LPKRCIRESHCRMKGQADLYTLFGVERSSLTVALDTELSQCTIEAIDFILLRDPEDRNFH
jgi:hypothetical protein